jgi:hypothetical protein
MVDIHNDAITILRVLNENGIVVGHSLTIAKLIEITDFEPKAVNQADTFLIQSGYIDGCGGGSDAQRWITSAGIEKLNFIMQNRYPLSLNAEKIVKYLITKVTREMEWGISIEIMADLGLTLEQYNQACQELLDFDLISGFDPMEGETLIDQINATPDGRRAYRRNYRDPVFDRNRGATRNITTNQYFEEEVHTEGGDIIGRYKFTTIDSNIIEKVLSTIEESHYPPDDKEDLKVDFQEILSEVEKGNQANESFVARRLRNIKRMAPDILETILAAMVNPASGFGMIAKKVAERIKADPG